jgi:tetratricopeptide (TPR) repeat protein
MKPSLEWSARYADAKARFESAATDDERFATLVTLAKGAFELGTLDEAETRAHEALALASTLRNNWNYGNAIHDGHSVLGRVALAKGDVSAAKDHLLKAGRTPGSPQLNSFGPNVSLARDLLANGEVSTVVEYFRLCQAFWEMENGKLAHWIQLAETGEAPDFGANVVY